MHLSRSISGPANTEESAGLTKEWARVFILHPFGMDEKQGHVGVGPGLGPSRLGQRGGDFGPKIQAVLGLNVSFPDYRGHKMI